MKQSFFKSFLLAIISFAMVFITSCNSEETTSNSYIDPSFAVFVSSYTSGTISAHSSVLIRLAEEVSEEVFNTDLPDDLFSFSPEVKGEAVWLDKQTVEFRPAASLTPGSSYTIKFNLGKIIEVPEDKSSFEYSIKTLVQNFDLRVQNLITTDVKNMEILEMEGVITTADLAEVANVEKMLLPSQNGKSLSVSWDHASDGLSHRFVIKNITRKETEDVLSLNIKGEPIGSEKTDVLEVKIPALGDFKVVDSYVEQKGEQHIVIRFSDPLLTSQQLQGLVTVQGVSNLSFDIRNNEILIYPSVRQTGQKRITLYAGIKNILGSTFDKTTELDIYFEQIKPQVRFAGNGSILPGNEGTILPFEAVGLKAIDVTVIRIFEENISQFYQVNQIDGNREIQRVGRPVLKKVIRLDEGLTDLTRWSRYSLDLSELIKIEPSAIYQVKIGFRKPHHNYYCQGEEPETDLDTMMPEDDSWDNIPEEDESSYWDYSEDYYYSDDYDWSERDNPCSDSYYGDRRSIKRNIFASNIGIIAKKGNSGSITVVSTDIISTSPLSGAKVEILDYQKRIIGESDTNGEGIANIPVTGQPFLVVVEYNNHKGYLRVDDGSALSMSNFDTQGQTVEKGIKGFIYGERGVWRPGDSLYFAFILEDKDNLLPEDHPVVFELTDPMGKLDKRLVNSSGVNGLYRFATTTDEKAPTGNWMAKVRVGGTAFSKSVKIETVKPNRLKINFENEKETITADDPRIKGDLKVNWLHGAPASYLNAEFDVNLIQRKTVFKGYEEFSFDDVAKQYNGEQFSLYKGKVDQNGEATIDLKLQPKNNPPGALTAQVSGRVYEEGGDFSIKSFSIPFYSYDVYTGIKPPKGDKARGMLLTDTTQTIDVVTLDSKGNPVSANVTLSLYKVEWRWWWDNTSYGANYVANSMNNQIQRGSIETKNGKGKWSFEVNYPDWGRYYVKACNNSSGHCTGKIIYIDWPGWAGRAQRDNPGGASMLSFSTDKQDYSVGEKVRVDIPGSAAGRALISIENGRKVVSTHWLETTKGENQFFFEATPEMAPGIYVSVTIVQKHAQTLNDLPIRMYGVTPVKITDPNTHLNPVLSMKDVLEPGKKVDLKISEQSGKPMTYTVAVVDEGLLDLTNFHTPDPWSNFYKREALGVKSFDMYEYVMGAYGGKLERLLAIGGDDELNAPDEKNNQNRFKPVVKFMGPFTLASGNTNTHSFTMPEYVGSVKTMVIAAENGAYGSTDKATPVRKPLMVLGTLPRVVGPGEKVTLPVNVFAMENNIKNVDVSIKISDLFKSSTLQKKITFNSIGDQIVNFDLDVIDKLGKAFVEITAKSGNQTATQRIDITVRNPNPPITTVQEAVLEAGKNWEVSYKAPGVEGTNSAFLEVSSIPPVDLSKRLGYLMNYPHGCIEQTVSSVFPQLYLPGIVELTGEQKTKIENNIKAGINKLRQFQLADGGFAYWPGLNEPNEWGSNYAGHFLLEAKRKGYNVPNNMLRDWKNYQSKMARNWKKKTKMEYEDLIQAYRLYTLALEGNPETGAMNRLRESGNLTLQTAWRLAAAYALSGQKEAALALTNNIGYDVPEKQNYWNYTYGSKERDEAMILETLGIMKEYVKAAPLVKRISSALSKNQWMSTQSTAYCLIAIGRFLENDTKKSDLTFDYTVNGKKTTAKTELTIVQIPVQINSQGGTLSVKNTGGQIIYPRLVLTGTPARGEEVTEEKGIKTNIIYKNMDGEKIDPANLSQGSNFIAEVTVTNIGLAGDLTDMSLSQIFPSGWEIINFRLNDINQPFKNSTFTYQDIRDDRVYTYFDLKRAQKKTFYVQLNASYLGEFYLPAIKCEAMYDNTVYSIQEGMDVKVVKRQ